MKHIICFSGGHSSAIVAIEVARKFGKENTILLNHDINPSKEDADIKRFKMEVASYLGIPITYANYGGITDPELLPDQFDISIMKKGFKAPNTGDAFCTYELKTKPFNQFLDEQFPVKDCVIYYGFDDDEQSRIIRRTFILEGRGYKTEYPLANWLDTIEDIEECGIQRPLSYADFKHGNCVGCLKGGLQHWFVTYCKRYDVFSKGKKTEELLGYAILKDQSTSPATAWPLEQLEPVFQRMRCAGVPASEHYPEHKFKKYLKQYRLPMLELFAPCECAA